MRIWYVYADRQLALLTSQQRQAFCLVEMGMYMHVFVCICMHLVYTRYSISMYLKNYVFASLYKFQLHVCACMILFLLEIRCCVGCSGG